MESRPLTEPFKKYEKVRNSTNKYDLIYYHKTNYIVAIHSKS